MANPRRVHFPGARPDCAKHCGINTNTWHSTYTSTGRAPQPVAELEKRMPLWDAEEVQTWRKTT
ncbi:hypothetical protein B1A54_08535 [Corynebacterium diphtheriae]|nr:hypothetical protein B1A54_08535 [Corynebacterium diphtheriae]UJL50484.1 hypothetical protein FE382_10700 [Corynebacterium diphtheriae]